MRRLLCALLFAAFVAAARGQDVTWNWPPLDGNVSGDFSLATMPEAGSFHWTAAAQKTENDTRHVVVTIQGNGLVATVEAAVNLATRIVHWTITDAKIDLKLWSPTITQQVKSTAGLEFSGSVAVTGSGVVLNNHPTGELKVVVQGGAIRNPTAGWSLEGVSLDGQFAVDDSGKTLRSTAPVALTVATITTKRFGARSLVVHGLLKDLTTFALASARLEIAGGDITAAPATIGLSPVGLMLDVTINRIGLQDVAALVPSAVRGARGRVDGTATVAWTESGGLEFEKGHLVLRHDEPAEVTLKAYPGLFTSGFPSFLKSPPRWLVRKSPVSVLEQAELGKTAIEAQSLDVKFSQQPDAEGRTAVVTLTGMPRGDASHTPVHIDTNVYGPLRPFIQLGATNFSLSVHE